MSYKVPFITVQVSVVFVPKKVPIQFVSFVAINVKSGDPNPKNL